MNQSDEVKLTISSILTKDNKPMVAVRFERGQDFAEGILPECEIQKSQGFSAEEKEALAAYLKNNRKMLLLKAKEISGITNMLK